MRHNLIHLKNICYLLVPRPTLGHWQGGSLAHSLLITANLLSSLHCPRTWYSACWHFVIVYLCLSFLLSLKVSPQHTMSSHISGLHLQLMLFCSFALLIFAVTDPQITLMFKPISTCYILCGLEVSIALLLSCL